MDSKYKEYSSYERIEYDEEDLELFRTLINKQLSNIVVEEYDKLLWKDFLSHFKNTFPELDEMYTGKISQVLRKLLHIDQDLHVRKGIKLTFREWLDLYS